MYYKLKADTDKQYQFALWEANCSGLDPEEFDAKALTFDIGTGNIEKVSRLISRHQLKVLIESEYADNSLAYRYGRMTDV